MSGMFQVVYSGVVPGALQAHDWMPACPCMLVAVAPNMAIHVQAEAAVALTASTQNTSRGVGHALCPTPSLDLKTLCLREQFSSLIDSSRGRAASARTAPGLSARQPLSARDRHPTNAPSNSIGNALASLCEEPHASQSSQSGTCSSSSSHSQPLVLSQGSGSPHGGGSPRTAEEANKDSLPSTAAVVSGRASEDASTGSGYSSSYPTSNSSSSRSNSPVADEDTCVRSSPNLQVGTSTLCLTC